jgi:hypothetical protein
MYFALATKTWQFVPQHNIFRLDNTWHFTNAETQQSHPINRLTSTYQRHITTTSHSDMLTDYNINRSPQRKLRHQRINAVISTSAHAHINTSTPTKSKTEKVSMINSPVKTSFYTCLAVMKKRVTHSFPPLTIPLNSHKTMPNEQVHDCLKEVLRKKFKARPKFCQKRTSLSN